MLFLKKNNTELQLQKCIFSKNLLSFISSQHRMYVLPRTTLLQLPSFPTTGWKWAGGTAPGKGSWAPPNSRPPGTQHLCTTLPQHLGASPLLTERLALHPIAHKLLLWKTTQRQLQWLVRVHEWACGCSFNPNLHPNKADSGWRGA